MGNMNKHEVMMEVLATVSGRAPGEITADKDLVADLGIDSPKALRLLVELEERLSIDIPDEDAARMSTVGDLVAYLESKG